MNKCRIALTLKCNLSCDFCCMKDPEMLETFTSCYFRDVDWEKYDEVSLTGGEPLLDVPRTARIIGAIRTLNPYCKIWLYTNATHLDYSTASLLKKMGLNGINISCHINLCYNELVYIHESTIPLRFLASEEEWTDALKYITKKFNIPYRIRHMDDCYDMEPEDRFILKR